MARSQKKKKKKTQRGGLVARRGGWWRQGQKGHGFTDKAILGLKLWQGFRASRKKKKKAGARRT